ncbi:hypothetical protein EJ04DRAFT_555963 [Polyplosphaeria fusca]|uniref:Rhodopsin domain-containing protein n=1 Tax=Polyplosphaeria fusca TaxID=682080 RepID=A0A9P4UV60_9PLEO|nr:hypothetical protein EJ04DRAFT_555963 [Polyplosphaeria fusca]
MDPSYLAEDNSSPLLQTSISFLVVESFFIALMYTARFLTRDQRSSHWMILLLTSAFCVCCGKITVAFLMLSIGGAGKHLAANSPATTRSLMKLLLAHQIICPLTTSLTKLGILVLFHQILARTSRYYKVAIQITFFLVLATAVIQVIIPFANCKPLAYNWNRRTMQGSCAFDGLALWRYLTIPNIVTTFVMVLIPLPALYKLQVTPASKFGLSLVFSVAIAGVVAATMRFHAFLTVSDFSDISFEIITPECWTIAESGIYLIVGVLPTLRPLVKLLCGDVNFDRMLSRTFGKTDASGNSSWKRGSGIEAKAPSELPSKAGIETGLIECEGDSRSHRSV